MKKSQKPTNQGFTLTELLVVIFIIAILVTVTINGVFKFRNSADEAVAIDNMRQIQIANVSYAGDNNGKFVPLEASVDAVTYPWFENPDFVSFLKTKQATYNTSGAPDTSLPLSLMDPPAVRKKITNYRSLGGSYGYTRPASEEPFHMSRLTYDSRSAAFITANSPFVDQSTKSNIAYRHDERKAIVVYYDGHAGTILRQQVDSKGDATNIFWQAVTEESLAP